MSATPSKVYGTSAFEYFAERLVAAAPERFERGALSRGVFPNGESRFEVLDFNAARDREVVLIGGTEQQDFFELLMYAGELAQVVARLNILLPFFRYATQERKDDGKDGHIVIAKGIARTLSGLPLAARGNRIFLVDPHTNSLAQYFDDTRIRAEILNCAAFNAQLLREHIPGALEQKVVASVDDGRPSSVLRVAKSLGLPFALIDKERLSGSETRVLGGVNGEVAGRIVVMIDDMARTLGSALGAAKAYRAAGASTVWLIATHADYAAGALEQARASGLLEGVLTSDSYPPHVQNDAGFSRTSSLAPFLAERLTGDFHL